VYPDAQRKNIRFHDISPIVTSRSAESISSRVGIGSRRQTCYQSDQSDEGLEIDLSKAILRPNLIDLFAKTRVVKSDLINLDKIELSKFKLT
jgi:hypothetical protein